MELDHLSKDAKQLLRAFGADEPEPHSGRAYGALAIARSSASGWATRSMSWQSSMATARGRS